MLRGHVPAGAAKLQPTGRLLATQKLDLVIGLPLRNRQELATLLQQISDLASPSFRHYLTPEQFAERFGPTEQDYQAVIAFANSNGLKVSGMHPNRTLLDVNATVADIERTFHLKMRT
jgi:kumamolisin